MWADMGYDRKRTRMNSEVFWLKPTGRTKSPFHKTEKSWEEVGWSVGVCVWW